MAYESFANNAHNNRSVSLAEHEQIAAPLGVSGLLGYNGTAPVYGDGSGLNVKLRAGVAASIRATRFNNLTETIIPIGSNTAGQARYDLVVLRLRRTESTTGAGDQYTIAPFVIQGTAAESPIVPSPVRTETPGAGFYDVPLAAVLVPAGASSIGAAQVSPRAYYIAGGGGYTGRDEWGKPPVEPGVTFRANDTAGTYIGTASNTWQSFYDDSGWVNVTVASGWSTSTTGRARVRRINKVVHLSLDVFRTGAAVSSGTVAVGEVPAGFAPDAAVLTLGSVNTIGGTCRFGIAPSRDITVAYFTPIDKGRAVSVQTQWPLA
ncbi:hypothetical protein [Micromonospora sp. RP3T]|uniref:hypothetical protein n=1 Tax=Micromonospora sp. RP3T TaxID=2135446 RepID=UPI003D72DF4E